MTCPHCSAVVPGGARFCEACGANLAPVSGVTGEHCRCGAGPDAKGTDGYCSVCGLRWPAAREPLPRDHVEVVLTPTFAGVTDRGKRHTCNEDALALADVPEDTSAALLVVCDGVSSAQRADEASDAAAQAACVVLRVAVQDAVVRGLTEDSPAMREAIMEAAIAAAHEAACAISYDPDKPKDPPGATVVAALVRGGTATLGWLGDSRAYWISPSSATLLTHDHSWVNAVVDAGEMNEEDALKAPEAHAITRCLGPLNDGVPEPTIRTVALNGPGCLLLCTDGLWNYAPETDQLAALVRAASGDALAVCRSLVEFALSKGGRDNITAALFAVGEKTGAGD
jgi:serine/threonine protein phosphatase PrpC